MTASLFDVLGAELGELLQPVVDAAADEGALARLIGRLGASTDAAGGGALAIAIGAVANLRAQIDVVLAQPSPSLDSIAALVDAAGRVFAAVRALSASGGVAAQLAGLGEDLIELLMSKYLRRFHPRLFATAALLGLVSVMGADPAPAPVMNGDQLVRDSFVIDRFHLAKLGAYIQDPLAAFRAEYGSTLDTDEQATAMAAKLFPRLVWFLDSFGLSTRYGLPDADRPIFGDAAPLVDHALLIYFLDPLRGNGDEAGVALTLSPDLGLAVTPFGTLTISTTAGDWTLTLTASAEVQAFAVGKAGVQLLSDTGADELSASFAATLPKPDGGKAAAIIGAPTGTRLEIGGAAVGADLALSLATRTLRVSAAVSSAALVISAGDADSFLQSVLPAGGLRADFDLGLAWSNSGGLSFHGAAGLDAALPLGVSVGPLSIPTMHLRLSADSAGITSEISASLGFSLGPIRAVADRLGVNAILTFPSDGGSLGLADLTLAWKPPSGVGLAIDAGPVTGGGYLGHADHQYNGALELSVLGVAVKAYGLVETQLPGGASGYSALVVLSAEFSPGLPIGFGFTLDGIGGLVGIHRTLSIANVQSALWSHHFDGLLFPKDPIAAAPSLMTSIDSFFPATEGRYLFGPLAKIGWGEGIMEALVGLIVELPEPVRLLLLGEIAVLVPVKLPQLQLHIDFDGGIDFGQKLAFFDARLHDSKIERYPIAGDLAFRYSWGDSPVFALSIGGFNPHFQPPANFPALKRLSVTIGDSGAQLVAQAYFALTSNTLQFGAKVELTAGTGSFNVHGWLGFDALVEWNPFAFTFDLSAGVELRHHTSVIASVHLEGHVSGTSPWHVSGEASISCWFFDISVHFDKSWGSSATALPATDPMPEVLAALANASSWTSVLPSSVRSVVTAQTQPNDAGGALLLDPVGALRIAQRVIPLGQPITRFGGTPLGRTLTVSVDSLNVLGNTQWTPTTEEFAQAQFEDLTDAQKLSLPSFTRLPAGAEIGADQVDLGQSARSRSVATPLAYDTIIIDSPTVHRPGDAYALAATAQLAMNARSGGARPAQPAPRIQLSADTYVIAGIADLKPRSDLAADGTKRGALQALAHYLDSNPSARGQLQVVRAQEAA